MVVVYHVSLGNTSPNCLVYSVAGWPYPVVWSHAEGKEGGGWSEREGVKRGDC